MGQGQDQPQRLNEAEPDINQRRSHRRSGDADDGHHARLGRAHRGNKDDDAGHQRVGSVTRGDDGRCPGLRPVRGNHFAQRQLLQVQELRELHGMQLKEDDR